MTIWMTEKDKKTADRQPSASKRKLDVLITDLLSTDPNAVLRALDRVPKQGRREVVIPLIKTRLAWPDRPAIQAKIEKILKELKSQDTVPELISALDNPSFDSQRAFIISLFWNAGLFPTDEFETLVQHALRGDYMVAFEVLTVVEHSEDQPDPDVLQQMILDVDEYLDRNPEAQHASVLHQLKEVLKEKYNL